MRVLLTSFILIIFSNHLYAQTEKKIEIVGRPIVNKDVFFVSDIRYHNDDISFICAMSVYVQEQYGVTNVAMEAGRSIAYLMNRYIQDNDSAFFFSAALPTTIKALEQWREINKALPPGHKITIYGVDFERMGFIKALQSVFKRHPEARSTALYQYVNGLPDSICHFNNITIKRHKAIRIETYGEAKDIFENEKEVLRPLLHSDYDIVAGIMENPVTEKQFGKRDIYIPVSILKQLDGKKFICFLGGDHTNVYRHFSTVRKYMRRTHNSSITIVSEVCKNFATRNFNSKSSGGQSNYITLGPESVCENDSVLSLGFGKYHKQRYFSLIDHAEFKGLVKKDNKGIPTYYVFSDLLKE